MEKIILKIKETIINATELKKVNTSFTYKKLCERDLKEALKNIEKLISQKDNFNFTNDQKQELVMLRDKAKNLKGL